MSTGPEEKISLLDADPRVQAAVIAMEQSKIVDDVGAVRSTVLSKLARDLGLTNEAFDARYGHLFPTHGPVVQAQTTLPLSADGGRYGHF